MRSAGASVLGPAASLEAARAAIGGETPDVAVLDVKLRDDFIYALVDELSVGGVQIVFTTGFDSEILPERYRHLPCYEKPVNFAKLVEGLGDLIRPS